MFNDEVIFKLEFSRRGRVVEEVEIERDFIY